jgi:hypothetical protein
LPAGPQPPSGQQITTARPLTDLDHSRKSGFFEVSYGMETRPMGEYSEAFVGIDVAKGRNAIAIADGERGGEVRYLGEVDASPASMTRIVRRLAEKYNRVQFCYEAGPTGYGLYRLITALGP